MTIITFNLEILSDYLYENKTIMKIFPFSPKQRRCTKCQRLNHTLKQCRSKISRCCRCGGNHSRSHCNAAHPECVNCSGEHSAAYKECPVILLRQAAGRLRSQKYMSFREALESAKSQQIKNQGQNIHYRSYSHALKEGRPLPDTDGLVRNHIVPLLNALPSMSALKECVTKLCCHVCGASELNLKEETKSVLEEAVFSRSTEKSNN